MFYPDASSALLRVVHQWLTFAYSRSSPPATSTYSRKIPILLPRAELRPVVRTELKRSSPVELRGRC